MNGLLCRVAVWASILTMSASAMAAGSTPLLLPRSFTLHDDESIQQLLVVRSFGGKEQGDVPESIGGLVDPKLYRLESSDPGVVDVDGTTARGVADGQATIRVLVDDNPVAESVVTVTGIDGSRTWSFRNNVQSVLARQGCNMGACHGALAGKGGFRLSLRGYDADADFAAIAREARGRRVELADPGRSLVLAKPTGALPHKGGLRLDVDSRDYHVIARWIADGASPPSTTDANLTHITVTPAASTLQPGDQTRVLVSAHYDSGQIIDVTHWAKFTATDEAVAGVDDDGVVTVRGHGEGAVLVWFGSRVQLARFTVAYPNRVDAQTYAQAPRRNFIDDLNLAQLQTLQLPPSPRCDDEAFLRRVTIDTVGRLPTTDELDQFAALLASGMDAATARDQTIDRLLSSEAFVDYWTYKLSDVLLITGSKLRPAAVKAYHDWLRRAVADGQPWDELVREILTSKGISTENGATNFYAIHQTPEDMTENACQAFLGLSIGCAKCHNHPLEKWTNDQYYAMANLFSRVRAKGWGGDTRNGDGVRTLYVETSGELLQPSTGQPQRPAPLDAPPLEFDDPGDRRVPLANWMTDPANPYFARAITNRIWANFFGRGLVEPIDDLRQSNPASHESLLTAASDHLVEVDFDLRSLMRTILQSETYQRDSRPTPGNETETKYLSRYYPRRMMAEVLLDAIDQTLGTTTRFDAVELNDSSTQKTDFYADGTRAIELYDSAVESYFLTTFGRNPREITCDCERSDEPSMVQVLHLSNGETLNPKLANQDNLVNRSLNDGVGEEQIVTDLFRRALARSPRPDELKTILDTIQQYGGDERVVAIQDAAWSILTSTEFTFNH